MQWEVAGTQGGTGLARSIVVNADDAAQARRLGSRQGWRVESVHPVDEPKEPVTVREAAPVTAPTAVVAPAIAKPPPRVGPSEERVTARARTLDRAALVLGVLGGLFVFAGALLVGCAAAVVPTSGRATALIAGLTAGLPVVAAGVMQLVTALAIHLLAELGRVVLKRAQPQMHADAHGSEAGKI